MPAIPGTRAGASYVVLAGGLGVLSEVSLADADYTIWGEAASDNAGAYLAGAGDVDGDGLADLLIGAHYNDAAGSSAGCAYVVLGGSLGSDPELSLADADHALYGEAASDYAGAGVSSAGDVDGDGLAELLVGALGNDDGGSGAGKVYLVLGASLAADPGMSLADADYALVGAAESDGIGYYLAAAGDVDGDGLGDVLVGAPGVGDAGAAYLFLGGSLGTPGARSVADADVTFGPESENGYLGRALTGVGDLDGDGYDDLLVSDPYLETGGASYVFAARDLVGSHVSTADALVRIADADGRSDSDYAGQLVVGGGDLDDDGLDDIVVIGSTRTCAFLAAELGGATALTLDEASGCLAGYAETAALAGDVDGDGRDDLLLGSSWTGSGFPGAAWLALADDFDAGGLAIEDVAYTFTAEAAGDQVGCGVAGAGDVDGDGLADLLIGARGNDDGGSGAGKAYLVLGTSLGADREVLLADADMGFLGEAVSDSIGRTLIGAGDVDGDGVPDLMFTAETNGEGGHWAGKVYLVLGTSVVPGSTMTLSDADYAFVGEADSVSGRHLAGPGDVDGDGLDDLLLGSQCSEAWLVLADGLGSPATRTISAAADYTFDTEATSSHTKVAAAGDVDGDQRADLLISSGSSSAVTYLVLADSLGVDHSLVLSTDADLALEGERADDYSGWAFDGAGDVNGDGLDDLIFGASGYDGEGISGAGYLVFAP